MDNIFVQGLWLACSLVTIVAALLAGRDRRWLYVGRGATAALFVVGGALVHVYNLVTGADYASFADPAHFQWVTDAWRAVVAPNQLLFIGLLIFFELTVGLLTICGGRLTQAGFIGVITFYLALWLFGPIETVFVLVMLVPMYLLLGAELRDTATPSPSTGQGPTRQPGHAA